MRVPRPPGQLSLSQSQQRRSKEPLSYGVRKCEIAHTVPAVQAVYVDAIMSVNTSLVHTNTEPRDVLPVCLLEHLNKCPLAAPSLPTPCFPATRPADGTRQLHPAVQALSATPNLASPEMTSQLFTARPQCSLSSYTSESPRNSRMLPRIISCPSGVRPRLLSYRSATPAASQGHGGHRMELFHPLHFGGETKRHFSYRILPHIMCTHVSGPNVHEMGN